MLSGTVAAADVVATGVAAVQAGRVEGCPLHAPAAAEEAVDRRAEQPPGHGQAQQAATGLLRRGKVGHDFQGQNPAQVGMVGELSCQAAVVGLEEGLEEQTGEQLVLCEFLGAVAVRI